MLINLKKHRVLLRLKTLTDGAMGETQVVSPVGYYHAAIKPLDAKAQAAYQQLGSVVTHEVTFSGEVSITLGANDIVWKDKTLTLVTPPKIVNGDTVIGVTE
jgi:hypothetical protein